MFALQEEDFAAFGEGTYIPPILSTLSNQWKTLSGLPLILIDIMKATCLHKPLRLKSCISGFKIR
jgi:hypothetical protein